MLNRKVKIAKTISLTSNSEKDEFLQLIYGVVLREIQSVMSHTPSIVTSSWSALRFNSHSLYTSLYSNIFRIINQYVNNDNYQTHIESRTGQYTKLKFKSVELTEYDWTVNLEFKLIFESEELFFLGFAGNIVWLTPTNDGLNTQMIDLDDKSISISHLVTDPFK